MAALTGLHSREMALHRPLRERWHLMRQLEVPRDRWASMGFLALGTASAVTAAAFRFLL